MQLKGNLIKSDLIQSSGVFSYVKKKKFYGTQIKANTIRNLNA